MTQRVNEKLKEMCRACNGHCDKPCAWLSLGNEYCTEIMNIQELLDEMQEQIVENEDESPYCSVCGHCGEIGCCGITNFLKEHVEGKTNCLNEGEILGEIESICEYETKVFKDNEAYKEKIAVALAKIDELQQDIFGLEDKMWIYQDLDRIKEVLKHD